MIRILVPVSDSACALAAVRHAIFRFHEGSLSEVVLLNVQPPLEHTRASAFHSLAALREQECRDGESALARASALLEESGVPYTAIVGVGEPCRAINATAESMHCEAIVIGASPWNRFQAWLGSGLLVRLIRKASVPVTVVHFPDLPGTPDSQPGRPGTRLLPGRPKLIVYP